jgi:hypothetical protein
MVAAMFLLVPVLKAQETTVAQDNQIDQEPQMAPDDSADPPSRVARVSFIDGTVSMQPGGTGEWGSASLNRPVTIGDKLWADQNSKLELQAGQASIHVGGMTALSLLNLDGTSTQMRLAEGRINFRVREIREGDLYEVDTPNLAFTVKQAGAFHVDVNENGDVTGVTIIRGEGEVAAGGQTYTVHAGERATITGMDNGVQYNVNAAPLNPDEFDKWADQRDTKEENSNSAKYVSRDVVGYSDLDDYGDWKEEPTYGNVWYPNSVSPDWAPYSNGNWSYVAPWGWTWVDYSPWGFAPFHYGRWIYGGGGWGWCPGPIYARPYYGPAFVGFLGGFHVGIGFGFGAGVGWFPLGWGEPYRPWYRAGGGYWNSINVHNTYIHNGNVNNFQHYNYAYARNNRAVTVASHNAFVGGQAINRRAGHISEATLRSARVTGGVNGAPTRASYFGAAGSNRRVSVPSSTVQNRTVMARTSPAAGASHLPVRTMNGGGLGSGRATATTGYTGRGGTQQPTNNRVGTFGGNTAYSTNRQAQVSANRPPSTMTQGAPTRSNSNNSSNNSARPTNAPARTWNAQGNATDSGRAPQGFGGNRPSVDNRGAQTMQGNRPPWARENASMNTGGNSRGGASNQSAPRNSVNRPPAYTNGNRSYNPPSYEGNRGNSSPRGSSAPPSYNGNRGGSAARTYSPPSAPRGSSAPRGYSAPQGSSSPRGSSAPRSSGGGSPHGGGGGSSHGGGGGSPHGGGGGGGPHGRH